MTIGVPNVGLYVAWANEPTDPSFNFEVAGSDGKVDGPGGSDITRYVRKLHYKRGRNSTLNIIPAGMGDITLNDSTRVFDPQNTASPYYPNIVPEKPIQVRAFFPGTTYYLATHFINRWPQSRRGPSYAQRDLTTTDGFDLLSLFALSGRNYGVGLTGSIIGSILNDASWPSGMRSISTGQSKIDTTGASGFGFSDTDSTKGLSFIQSIVGPGGENGLFYIAGNGYATFLDNHTQFNPPFNTSQATFSDVETTAGEFQYADIQPTSDTDLIVNDWSGTTSTGTRQEAMDSNSFKSYGRRTQTVTSYLTTDTDTMSSMQYNLSIYKNPLQRVQAIKIKPGNYQELWTQCLTREIGDRITVKQHPPGGGQAIIEDYTIQAIDATFDIGPVVSATYTWSLFPASAAVFMLDDATNGQLDVSRLGL